MVSIRTARCMNEIEVEHPTLAYVPCLGILTFRPEDRDAACDTCGARCGCLVADYIGLSGPWPEAVKRWKDEVMELWRQDHAAEHPRGRGACPICTLASPA